MSNIDGRSKTQRAAEYLSLATASLLAGVKFLVVGLTIAAVNSGYAGAQVPAAAASAGAPIKFKMVVSGGAATCLPKATATVKIHSTGPVEIMDVTVKNLPPKTDFDLFVIQVPNAPFGLAWYQGDIETDEDGEGHQQFVGRFSIETFAIAQAPSQPAPVVHHPPQSLVQDDSFNPVFDPIHTFHLGLWFNSPADAAKAGCPAKETPFNGEHNAGIQVLHTVPLADGLGPLSQVK